MDLKWVILLLKEIAKSKLEIRSVIEVPNPTFSLILARTYMRTRFHLKHDPPSAHGYGSGVELQPLSSEATAGGGSIRDGILIAGKSAAGLSA